MVLRKVFISLVVLCLAASNCSVALSCEVTVSAKTDFKSIRAKFNGDTIHFSLPSRFQPVSDEQTKALSNSVSQLKAWVVRSAPDAPVSETLEIRSLQSPENQPNATSVSRLASLHGRLYLASCPDSFSFGTLPALIREAPEQESYGVVLACGDVRISTPRRSDISASYFIRGAKDFYVLTWSQLAEPRNKALDIDRDAWLERIRSLFPLQVCPVEIN